MEIIAPFIVIYILSLMAATVGMAVLERIVRLVKIDLSHTDIPRNFRKFAWFLFYAWLFIIVLIGIGFSLDAHRSSLPFFLFFSFGNALGLISLYVVINSKWSLINWVYKAGLLIWIFLINPFNAFSILFFGFLYRISGISTF